MESPETRQLPAWSVTVSLILACLLLVNHALFFNFLNDDAFISFRYADNLVRHGELVFNLGERVEGYTNFLWTVLMAAVLGLGLDVGTWSKILSIAAALSTMLVLTRFLENLITERHPLITLAAWLLAAAPCYACWSTGGLETQLFTLLMTLGWTGYLDALHRDEPRFALCGCWFALAAMTRPEGMLVFGLVCVFHAIRVITLERRITPSGSEWKFLAVFLLLFGPFFAWRWSYYGWPFPNTYYVKTGAVGFWAPGFRYFLSWVNDHWLWVVPLAAVGALFKVDDSRRSAIYLSCLLIAAYSLHVIRVGGDFMGLHRFLVPLMPLVVILVALGAMQAWDKVILWPAWRYAVLALSILTAGLGVYHVSLVDRQAMTVGSDSGVDRIGWLKQFHGQCEFIGKWLAKNAPPDAVIATTAAGIIPYYSRLHTVDVLGLNDEWVAHNVKAHGNRPGHTKSAPLSYILKKQVDYLVYHPTITARPVRRSPSEERVWRSRGYEWRSVEVEGLAPPWWSFWRRLETSDTQNSNPTPSN